MIRRFTIVISLCATSLPVQCMRFYLGNYNLRLWLVIIGGGIARHTRTHCLLCTTNWFAWCKVRPSLHNIQSRHTGDWVAKVNNRLTLRPSILEMADPSQLMSPVLISESNQFHWDKVILVRITLISLPSVCNQIYFREIFWNISGRQTSPQC